MKNREKAFMQKAERRQEPTDGAPNEPDFERLNFCLDDVTAGLEAFKKEWERLEREQGQEYRDVGEWLSNSFKNMTERRDYLEDAMTSLTNIQREKESNNHGKANA